MALPVLGLVAVLLERSHWSPVRAGTGSVTGPESNSSFGGDFDSCDPIQQIAYLSGKIEAQTALYEKLIAELRAEKEEIAFSKERLSSQLDSAQEECKLLKAAIRGLESTKAADKDGLMLKRKATLRKSTLTGRSVNYTRLTFVSKLLKRIDS